MKALVKNELRLTRKLLLIWMGICLFSSILGFEWKHFLTFLFNLLGTLVLILYGAIYHFRNPGQDIEKVKNRVVITFSIVFFGALVIIRLAQIINA